MASQNQNYFVNCETVEQAKKEYWRLAKQFHPDMGGDAETMKKINEEFNSFQPTVTNKGHEFKGNYDFSLFSQDFVAIVNSLLSIADKVTVEICGDWIWISGDTYPYKETIKSSIANSNGYKVGFAKKKLAWYISPADYKKRSKKQYSLNEIRNSFGSQQISKDDEQNKIES
jgi:curved DNA-binding protein CbpA